MNNNKSPMFLHALESFEHGLEHYLDGTERSRKFSLLHLDQAVELILKEKIVRLGKSIYKSSGATFSIHESFNSLKGIDIPERPRLEEIHDLQNTVQHKGMTPDPASTDFYVGVLYNFMKRFLSEELDSSIEDTINQRYRAMIEGVPVPEVEQIEDAFEKSNEIKTPAGKILAGYAALNIAVNFLSKPDLGISGIRSILRHAAEENGNSNDHIKSHLVTIMRLRNEVVHSDYDATESDAVKFLKSVKVVLRKVGVLN